MSNCRGSEVERQKLKVECSEKSESWSDPKTWVSKTNPGHPVMPKEMTMSYELGTMILTMSDYRIMVSC